MIRSASAPLRHLAVTSGYIAKPSATIDRIETIYSWLMERDISAWNLHAPPMTDAKRETEDVRGNPQFDYVADL